MTQAALVATVLAALLILFGAATIAFQVRGRRRLAARSHVPSDELAYFQARYRRRMITGILIVLIGALLAGAYATGLEPSIDALQNGEPAGEGAEPKEMTPEQKNLVRMWAGYWIGVILVVFAVLGLAFADAWATRHYALLQYRVMRDDHDRKLRRDLAVYKAQRDASRMGHASES